MRQLVLGKGHTDLLVELITVHTSRLFPWEAIVLVGSYWLEVRIFLRMSYNENLYFFSFCPIAMHCTILKNPMNECSIYFGHYTSGSNSRTIISAKTHMSEKKWHQMFYKYLTRFSHQLFQILILEFYSLRYLSLLLKIFPHLLVYIILEKGLWNWAFI